MSALVPSSGMFSWGCAADVSPSDCICGVWGFFSFLSSGSSSTVEAYPFGPVPLLLAAFGYLGHSTAHCFETAVYVLRPSLGQGMSPVRHGGCCGIFELERRSFPVSCSNEGWVQHFLLPVTPGLSFNHTHPPIGPFL